MEPVATSTSGMVLEHLRRGRRGAEGERQPLDDWNRSPDRRPPKETYAQSPVTHCSTLQYDPPSPSTLSHTCFSVVLQLASSSCLQRVARAATARSSVEIETNLAAVSSHTFSSGGGEESQASGNGPNAIINAWFVLQFYRKNTNPSKTQTL